MRVLVLLGLAAAIQKVYGLKGCPSTATNMRPALTRLICIGDGCRAQQLPCFLPLAQQSGRKHLPTGTQIDRIEAARKSAILCVVGEAIVEKKTKFTIHHERDPQRLLPCG